MVAPDSPTARAQLNVNPAAMAVSEIGSVTRGNSISPEAPSTLAASSISSGIDAKPTCAARIKKGADTNVCAMTTAAVVNGNSTPIEASAGPRKPRLPDVINSANPATVGGKTIGNSTSTLTRL